MNKVESIIDLQLIDEKLRDAQISGAVIEFDPDEAEAAGIFRETALTAEEAEESMFDEDLGEE